MGNTQKQPSFMSALLIIFTAIVAVSVLFALASSGSLLAELISFALGLVAFVALIFLAVRQIQKD